MFRKFFAMLCMCGLVSATETFEGLSGGVTDSAIKYGTLKAEKGHAAIDVGHGHNKSKKALHIMGGQNRQVTVQLKQPLKADTLCEFYLERWTKGNPFCFTVSADGSELYRNDKLQTGPFPGHVFITLPAGTQSFTMSCNSPDKGGALIDDLTIHSGPMVVKSVAVEKPGVYPIMKNGLYNPAVRFRYSVSGSENALTPGTITFKVTPGTLGKVTLRTGSEDGTHFEDTVVYGSAKPAEDGTVTITCKKKLQAGDHTFWLDATPSDSCKVGATVKFSDFSISTGDKNFTPKLAPVTQRVGYMLALPGTPVGNQPDGASDRDCLAFRIPGIITTKKGTLIGVFDARYTHGRDLCADIDVAFVRSTDGGQTWSKPKIALDGGPGDANGCGDPAIVQDKNGRIWLQALHCHFKGGASLWTSKKGNDYNTTGQWEMTYSDDDGKTWAEEHVNPTKSIKKDQWHCILAGPGCAITKKDGTIVFPAQIWQNDAKPPSRSTICYSKDGGKTWVMGEGVPFRSSECQVVELPDGSLMLNCRNENRAGKRAVYITKDLGKTWSEHASHLKLQEPSGACQASLYAIGNGQKLLFSNPKSSKRDHMTIRYSADSGKTWTNGLEYDTRGCAGYSCITMVDKETVGIIYEGGFPGENGNTLAICFLRIPLKAIIKAK